jgi:hypothetical protein
MAASGIHLVIIYSKIKLIGDIYCISRCTQSSLMLYIFVLIENETPHDSESR